MKKFSFNTFILALVIFAFCEILAIRVFADKVKKPVPVDEELRLKANDEEGNELKSLKAELLISRSDEKALAQLQKLLKKLTSKLHFKKKSNLLIYFKP